MALFVALLAGALSAFGQSDRATLTGTISDPSGASLAAVTVEARNADTNLVYQTESSLSGNYSLPELPTGTYQLIVGKDGFRTIRQSPVFLPVAQTVRVDFRMEVGASTESITVTDQGSPLKTETGEISHNITSGKLNGLPVLPIGVSNGLRNPYALLTLLPGASVNQDIAIRINGLPANTQTFRVDGQETTNGLSVVQSNAQPSVEAIQEVAVHTSSYAAEFGQAGGGVLNATMKSGTNELHGSAYDYAKNEALNAGFAYTNNGNGEKIRNRIRQHDYGFSIGGPVRIPKLYDGRDQTFFFLNFEQFRELQGLRATSRTVPTAAMRTGDFGGAILTNRLLGIDQAGRQLFENQVFDWRTETKTSAGVRVWNAFPGNLIPLAALDPVALKIQSYMPVPTAAGLTNNYSAPYDNARISSVPSVKIDQNLGSRAKLSFYWSRTVVHNDNADGMPFPISSAKGTNNWANTSRLNFNYTWTPSLLLHLAAGLLDTQNVDQVQDYNLEKELGFRGATANHFFTILGTLGAYGGYNSNSRMGPAGANRLGNIKPTFTASLSWVRGSHTAKFGSELITDGYPNVSTSYASPWFNFSNQQTATPSSEGQTLIGGTIGLPYASFLTGRVFSGTTSVPTSIRLGKKAIALFAQDTWKITPRFTLDYGLRYDFQTYLRESQGYLANLGPNTPNPALDGRLGGTIFEGYGPGRCQCSFAKNYPWAFAPRLSGAFQLTPKTVLRGGFGLSYTRTASNNTQSLGAASPTQFQTTRFADPVVTLADGINIPVTFPNFDASQFPFRGQPAGSPAFFDQNAGRPGRILQWNFSIQRELARNLWVEVNYLGNRGAWFQSGALVNDTALQVDELKKFGLDPTVAADRQVLTSALASTTAIQRGFGNRPYSLFPTTLNVAQALNPYPQYQSITRLWAPLGSTWYNALQATANKRFSHGLEFDANLTWSRQMTMGAENEGVLFQLATPQVNDVFNRAQNKYLSSFDQPLMLILSGSYITPRWNINKTVSLLIRDWQIGTVLRYGSGFPIRVPGSNTGSTLGSYLRRSTWANRVPGQPLFLHDLNCKCFDPAYTVVLNPAAWSDPPVGQFSTAAAYYSDFRTQRRPTENITFGRNFRSREGRFNLNIRVEFANMFNRLVLANPSTASFSALPNHLVSADPSSPYSGGYGVINTISTGSQNPRSGTLVARFTF